MSREGSMVPAASLWRLAVILGLWFSYVLAQAPGGSVPIANGTDLARELQTAFSAGGTRTLLISSDVTLDGAVYTMLNSTIDSGSVFINGTNSNRTSVVDLAMRSPAILSLSGAAKLYWTNLVFVNGCSMPVPWNENSTWVTIESSAHYFFAETRSQTMEALGNTNVTAYVTQAEVFSLVYWIVVSQTPFQEVKDAVKAAVDRFNGTTVAVREVTPYSVTLASFRRLPYLSQNFTLRATNDPSSPAAYRLPSLTSPAQPGTAMPHAFCNGTLLNTEQQQTNMSMFPIWIQKDSEGLQGALVAAANYTSNKHAADPPPVIFLTGNTTMGGENGQFPAVTMRAECMLHGPFNHDRTSRKLVSLSLGNRANTVQLALLSKLYISRLVVKDLMAAPLGNLAQDPLGDNYVSALPLWGINIASRVNVQVLLDNVTLVVPPDDFKALLAAAQRGPQWKTGSVKTRPIINLIQQFVVDPTVPYNLQSLTLSTYLASGVSASNVIFVPSEPIADDNSPLPDIPSAPPPPATQKKSNVAVAAGVGAGVGGGLLLAVILGVVLWVRNRRAAAAQAQAAHFAELGKAKSGLGGTPPGSNNPHGQNGSKSSSIMMGPQSASTTDGRNRIMGAGPINVAALHAAVRANQATASNGSPMQSSQSGVLDPRKAVQQAAGAMGAQDADKLTLLGVLGRGTWGTVYRGLWRNLDVAVKTVLFSDRTDGKGSLPHERAIMEAAVCTSVAHRNVVSTFHYDIKPVQAVEGGDGLQVAMADDSEALLVTEWKLYLVQEWCNTTMGEALRQSLLHAKESHDPQMDLLLTLLSDVVAGVEYLHSKNIIHGDLKPENVMLKMDPSAPIGVVAKITDFGLSTTLGPQATHVSNYNSGTPFYVAPEVLSEGRATKASDIYSFGVLLWEVFNCMPPWVKGKDGAYKPNPRFPTFPPSAPKRFATLTQRCMMRDWRQRPTLADVIAEVKAMHEAWLDGFDSLELPATGAAAGAAGAAAAGAGEGSPVGADGAQPHMKRCRTAEIAGEGAAKALSEFVGARTPDQQVMQGYCQ